MDFAMLALIGAAMWVLQLVLGLWQFRRFSAHVKKLRPEGRVAIGKAKGRFSPGAIILLVIDGECTIRRGELMSGFTVLAGFKPLEVLNGMNLLSLTEENVTAAGLKGKAREAALSARHEYEVFQEGKSAQKA